MGLWWETNQRRQADTSRRHEEPGESFSYICWMFAFLWERKTGKNNPQKRDVGCLMVHLSHSPLANNTALQSIAWRVSHDALRCSPNLMCKSLRRTFSKPKEPTSDFNILSLLSSPQSFNTFHCRSLLFHFNSQSRWGESLLIGLNVLSPSGQNCLSPSLQCFHRGFLQATGN